MPSPRAWPAAVLCSALATAIAAQTTSVAPPTRPIEFRVDEGTWMSLDVAPDGQTIVFDLLGTIYAMPSTGGTAQRLIGGPGFSGQPRFSPDGRTVAFVSDRNGSDNVWLAGADGTNPRLLTALPRARMLSPAWTTDGRGILVTVLDVAAMRTAELWRFDVATGAGVRVVENGNGPASPLVSSVGPGPYGAAPTPDGRSLYYASATPRAYGSRNGATSRLIRRDLTSGGEEPVVVEQTNPMRPLVSPNGAVLAYAGETGGRTGLRIRTLADGRERWIAFPIDPNELEAAATRDLVPGYAFTPDSRAVVAAFGGKIHQVDLTTGADRVIPFDATVRLDVRPRLTFPRRVDEGPVRATFVESPALRGDGRLAVSALARIYLVDRAGAPPRRLTRTVNPREYQPAWSPDGRWVAFVTWTADGGHLWKARADGSAPPERLSTEAAFYADPTWAPDGSRLVLLRAPEGSARTQRGSSLAGPVGLPPDVAFISIPSLGGPATTIGPAGSLRRPRFAADPTRFYAWSTAAGLVSVGVRDGHRAVVATLAKGATPPGPPTGDGVIAPDGRDLLVRLGDRLHRFPLTPAHEPQTLDPAAVEATVLTSDAPESADWASDGRTMVWTTGATLHLAPRGEPGGGAPTRREIAVEIPRATPAGAIVLRGVRAITMRGDEVIEDADLVVDANRITAIGPRGTVSLPPGARHFELAGRTVMPGLIDIHAHWDISDRFLEPDYSSPYANLAYGVTTVRDPQAPPAIFAHAEMEAIGEVPGPRILSTGPGLFIDLNLRTVDDGRRVLGRYRDRYRTTLLKSYALGPRAQRQLLIEAAAGLGMMPTAEGLSDTKADLTHAIDGMSGTEHALPTVPLRRDIIELFARTGITYTPTLLVSFGGPFPLFRMMATENPFEDPKLRRFFPEEALYQRAATRQLQFRDEDSRHRAQAAGAAAILRAGGRVGLGGHGEMQGLQNHWEMRLLAEGGMTPHEVLRVGTIMGAEAIGLAADLGSLEPGKLADLVILDRNPLDDIRHTTAIKSVMRNGVLYDGSTLDRVWPDPRPLPTPWWWRFTAAASKLTP